MRRFITESSFLIGYYLYRSGRTDIGWSLLQWAAVRWMEDSTQALTDLTGAFAQCSLAIKASSDSFISLMLTLNRLQALEAS